MSFQSLISGSECAAPANPLSQVLKHTEGDRSLQQDRIAGPSSARLHHLPGTASAIPANEQDLALARQFFDGQPHVHGIRPAFPAHHPSDIARFNEMNAGQAMPEAWAVEHQAKLRDPAGPAAWSAEFGMAPQIDGSVPQQQQSLPVRMEFQQRPSLVNPMYSSGLSMGAYGMGMQNMQYPMTPNVTLGYNGKGKGKEVDFEAAFAQFASESLESSEQTTSRIEEVDDSVSNIADTLNEVKLGETSDFKEVWDQLQNGDAPPPKEDMAKWEAEFSQLMNNERDELDDYSKVMQNAWEGGVGNYEGVQLDSPEQFDNEGLPILGDYIFEQNNKYLDPSSSRSLLADAKALLEQNGSLSEAALMLEAAIQRGELGEGGYETWVLLGETRNMDEREEAGMRALMQGVKISEASGVPGPGMLSLAISFTNESYDRASHVMLLRWFRARYPDAPVPQETIDAVGKNSAWDTHGRITDVFLNLARSQHANNTMDADLQIALGVLFYTNSEYERAQDCFVTALNVRPRDYILWNRLGSSLSNGSKPEEALGAYREALQLRPTYTRAIYNVGVACLNIGADKEAAEHFLGALSLQEQTGGDTSDQLWFTLRRALSSMGRNDLAELASPEKKTSLDVFRTAGLEF